MTPQMNTYLLHGDPKDVDKIMANGAGRATGGGPPKKKIKYRIAVIRRNSIEILVGNRGHLLVRVSSGL